MYFLRHSRISKPWQRCGRIVSLSRDTWIALCGLFRFEVRFDVAYFTKKSLSITVTGTVNGTFQYLAEQHLLLTFNDL